MAATGGNTGEMDTHEHNLREDQLDDNTSLIEGKFDHPPEFDGTGQQDFELYRCRLIATLERNGISQLVEAPDLITWTRRKEDMARRYMRSLIVAGLGDKALRLVYKLQDPIEMLAKLETEYASTRIFNRISLLSKLLRTRLESSMNFDDYVDNFRKMVEDLST